MDLTTLIGIVMALGLILWGIGLDKLGNFVDMQSLAIVLGGAIAATIASYPFRILKDVPKHIMVCFRGSGKYSIPKVVDQLVDGTYAHGNSEMYRDLHNSLFTKKGSPRPDMYFILKDFRAYAEAQEKVEEAYRDKDRWAKMALLNTACCGKFSSDRTILEYVDDIWKLDKITVESREEE